MSGTPKLQKTDRAQFLVDNLNLPQASGIEDAVWEHFQLDHLNDDSVFRIDDKSRQIAWSFTGSAEAVADAILEKRDSIFSSINHEEAKEKIRYAKAVYENLEISGLPKLIIDNQLELEFDTGVRLTSFPARPVRGRPKSNWYGDEFAHIQNDRKIYKGSLPIISKGGRIRIGSSPLGASGLFWEIFTESLQKYPGYTRKKTPWWEVQAFCTNVREARRLAPTLSTFERVELFGKDRIKAIYANLPTEDFQQEYECEFVDETTAWITWAEITANQSVDAEGNDTLLCLKAECRDDDISAAMQRIEDLADEIAAGNCESVVAVGCDIGRTRNASEFFVVGLNNLGSYPLRLMLTLNNCPFPEQEAVLRKLFTTLPVVGGEIDDGGLGMQLAQSMAKEFPYKVREAHFTQESKKLWATDAKMLFQKRKVPIPVNRDLAYQIHSVKKLVSPSKNVLFDTDRNEKHHADKFWALALALAAARREWVVDDGLMIGSFSFGFNS
jgi:phage FluMu gp28-like protein